MRAVLNRLLPQSITGDSDLGNYLRRNVGLVGGILGDIGDILSGLGNVAAGMVTFDQFGDIPTGLSELGGGALGLAQIGLTDVMAGVVSATGYAYNLGYNAVNGKDSGNHVPSACGLRRYAASDRSTYLLGAAVIGRDGRPAALKIRSLWRTSSASRRWPQPSRHRSSRA